MIPHISVWGFVFLVGIPLLLPPSSLPSSVVSHSHLSHSCLLVALLVRTASTGSSRAAGVRARGALVTRGSPANLQSRCGARARWKWRCHCELQPRGPG